MKGLNMPSGGKTSESGFGSRQFTGYIFTQMAYCYKVHPVFPLKLGMAKFKEALRPGDLVFLVMNRIVHVAIVLIILRPAKGGPYRSRKHLLSVLSG
ncbi:MAG: hypothetical protein IPO26_21220 [Saprospiraceae bacterium]|nr:hypothetical protein [Saprospiraceae bacterium]